MKTHTKLISGIAASFLLAVGLHAAAEKLDPITNNLGTQNLADSTTDSDQQSVPPCWIED